MKKLITLIAVFTMGFVSTSNAQIEEYTIYPDSLEGCQSQIYGYVSCGVFDEPNGQIIVDWGDGSTNTYDVAIESNDWVYFNHPHNYAVAGTYNVNAQFYSNVLTGYVGSGVQQEIIANDPASCGYFYASIITPAPTIYIWDAPMDCLGADGIITTVVPGTYFYGNYSGLNPANAPYTVSINPAWLTDNGYIQTSPNQTITSFSSDGLANNSQMSFTVTCTLPVNNPDFDIEYLYPSAFVAPLETGNVILSICNLACSDTSDATVSLNFPADFVPNISNLTNASINGNTLTFDLLSLSGCQYVAIPFTFPGGTPAGTNICFDATVISPEDTDNSNNTQEGCTQVLNSYDPNSKEVDQAETLDPATQETLKYVVHFQNDGNYNAVNVKVTDPISENLDLNSFRLIGSKHQVSYNIDPATRVVTFSFNQIFLEPSSDNLEASQGFVIYEIDEAAGLQEGDEIENTAYIYFDFNSPIVTNTTYNINQTLSLDDAKLANISIYPNPTTGNFTVKGQDLEEIRVFDMLGKEVLFAKLTNTNSVDVNNLTNGIYNTVIITKSGAYQQKLTIKK